MSPARDSMATPCGARTHSDLVGDSSLQHRGEAGTARRGGRDGDSWRAFSSPSLAPHVPQVAARVRPDGGRLHRRVEHGATLAGDPEQRRAHHHLLPVGREERPALGVGHAEAAGRALQPVPACRKDAKQESRTEPEKRESGVWSRPGPGWDPPRNICEATAPSSSRTLSEKFMEDSMVMGWPLRERMLDAMRASRTMAWPLSCRPPATTRSLPIPSCNRELKHDRHMREHR